MQIDFNTVDRETLIEAVGEEIADAILLKRLQDADESVEIDEEEYSDNEFSLIVEDRKQYAKLNKTEKEIANRWSEIEVLRSHYALFEDLLYDCMTELMGFNCTELQIDIGRFLQSDVQYGMIQAQRSQAKSTNFLINGAFWGLKTSCNGGPGVNVS